MPNRYIIKKNQQYMCYFETKHDTVAPLILKSVNIKVAKKRVVSHTIQIRCLTFMIV